MMMMIICKLNTIGDCHSYVDDSSNDGSLSRQPIRAQEIFFEPIREPDLGNVTHMT